MKHIYHVSWKLDSSPVHLLWSLIFALYVMFFINGFIGSMGGVPAAIAFFCVYFLLRSMMMRGQRITHQLAMTSRGEVLHAFLHYTVGYALVWAVAMVLQVFARITGWGNIEGMSFKTYLNNLYGSTMLERWAYLFVAILMFAYAFSLFPIVLMRKNKHIAMYLAGDSLFFMLVCYGVRALCNIYIDDKLQNRATCLLDSMLLCELPKKWQAVSYMLGVIAFLLVASYVALRIGIYTYGPKPGSTQVDPSRFPQVEEDEDFLEAYRRLERHRRNTWIISGAIILTALLAIAIYMFLPTNSEDGYDKVAEYLTEDAVLGPMSYEGDIYIPVNVDLNYFDEGTALGYLGYKGQNCDSRFYQLAIANVLYKESGSDYLQMFGADQCCFLRASLVERENLWKQDNIFFLWDEDWAGETSYNMDPTGYTYIDKAYIESLEQEYGVVDYSEADFADYDAYFTIRGYANIADPLENAEYCGDWVGCILVRDNQFYYGSYENPITDVYLQELLEVLGGNQPAEAEPETETEVTEGIEEEATDAEE